MSRSQSLASLPHPNTALSCMPWPSQALSILHQELPRSTGRLQPPPWGISRMQSTGMLPATWLPKISGRKVSKAYVGGEAEVSAPQQSPEKGLSPGTFMVPEGDGHTWPYCVATGKAKCARGGSAM